MSSRSFATADNRTAMPGSGTGSRIGESAPQARSVQGPLRHVLQEESFELLLRGFRVLTPQLLQEHRAAELQRLEGGSKTGASPRLEDRRS